MMRDNTVPRMPRMPRPKAARIGQTPLKGFEKGRIIVDTKGQIYREEGVLVGAMRVVRPLLVTRDVGIHPAANVQHLDLKMVFKQGGGEILDVIGAYNNPAHVLPAGIEIAMDRQNDPKHPLSDYVALARAPTTWRTTGGIPMADGKTYDKKEIPIFRNGLAH